MQDFTAPAGAKKWRPDAEKTLKNQGFVTFLLPSSEKIRQPLPRLCFLLFPVGFPYNFSMTRLKKMLKGKYFLNWILAFLVILLLPVIFGMIIYLAALNNLRDEMDLNQSQYMHQKSSQITALTQESFYRCYTALSNNAASQYAKGGDAALLPSVSLSLSRTMNASSNYQTAFLFFPKQGKLIGTNSETEASNSASVEAVSGIPYEDFVRICENPPSGTWNSFYFSEENQLAVYLTNFGSQKADAPLMFLFLNFNKFRTLLHSEVGTVYIIQNTGGYLSSDGEEMPEEIAAAYRSAHSTISEKTETENFYTYSQYAEKTGLYLTYAVKKSYFSQRLSPLRLYLFLYIGICLVGGALFAFFVTRRQYRPVAEVFDLINEDSPIDSEFGALKTHIQTLQREKEKSEYQEKQLEEVSRNVTLHALLKGRIRAIDPDADLDLSKFGIEDRFPYYLVTAFEVEDLGSFTALQEAGEVSNAVDYLFELMRQVIENSYGKEYDYMVGEVDGNLICLLNTEEDSLQTLSVVSETARRICAYFYDSGKILLTANISGFCSEKAGLIESYSQIRILSEFRNNIGTDKKVITWEEFNTKNALTNADIYKNEAYIKSLLDEHNYQLAQEELKKILKQSRSEGGDESEKGSDYARQLTDKVIAFIELNYSDPQLAVGGIAETLDVNLSYMSRVFKNNTGKGILEYISEVRIDAACRYLDQGYSLKEAAELVGYYTQRSFQRAFEKVKGMKPGQYKNS